MNEMNLTDHWKVLSFTDCLKKVKSKKKPSIPKKDYQESGQFPVIDQGASFIAGWTDYAESVISDNLPVVIFGDHTRIFKYVDFPFALGADGTKLLHVNDDIFDPRFFYYALLNLNVPHKGYNRHYRYLREFSVVCPPLPEQREIAHILQTIQEAKSTRQREIALERERKAALMDFFFSHGTKEEPRKQTEISEIPESWEVVRLGDIADITYGVQAAVAHLLDESIGLPILTNINITLDGTFDLSTLRYYELPKDKKDKLILKKGDLLFNWRSGSQHHVGKTVLFDLDGEYTFSSFILRFRFAEKINNVFAFHYFHYLREKGFFALKRSQSSVNSVFNASKSAEIPVVIPSVEEQSGISGVLQACDAKITALEQESARLDELFHAMLDELMTGQRSAVPLIDTEMDV